MLPDSSTQSEHGGHPQGGPRVFPTTARALVGFVAFLCMGLTACGGMSAPERPQPRGAPSLGRPLDMYRDLGFLTGPPQFPAIASFRTLAGPADSTFLLLGLSLPNSALRFQREGTGFLAEYGVSLALLRDTTVVAQFAAHEVVRVPTFAETGRTDESIVYQRAIALEPGRYTLRLEVGDMHSSRAFRMTDTIAAPVYGAGRNLVSQPLLVYEALGRTERAALPHIVYNPRHTVAYGADRPRVYLETYGAGDAGSAVRVLDDGGAALWQAAPVWQRGGELLRYTVIEIPQDSLPVGRIWLEVAHAGATSERTPLLLTISDEWMVTNFEQVLELLRYIATDQELDSLSLGSPSQRRDRWEAFWRARDPLPITAVNEFRDEFFERVRYATDAFREPDVAGWQSDRGGVYIVLGSPDEVIDRSALSDVGARTVEWIYSRAPTGRLALVFTERRGFGVLELEPSSAAAFRTASERLKPQRDRGR